MKYLKYFLILIAVLIIIFFGKGMLTPEISYENEVIVNKPSAEAWAVMADEATTSEWIEGFKRMEHVSGTPNTVGAVSNVYVEEGGEEMMMQETITDIKINERMAMKFTMDFMDMDYEINLDEKEGKTHIRTKSTTRGNGIFAKSMISFMPSSMKAQEDKNLNSLKEVIEANTKNYFPEPVLDTIQKVMN